MSWVVLLKDEKLSSVHIVFPYVHADPLSSFFFCLNLLA